MKSKLSVIISPCDSAAYAQSLLSVQAATVGMEVETVQDMHRCKGEYVLRLHAGAVVGEGVLRSLCFFLDEHPEAGAVGVQLLDGKGHPLPQDADVLSSACVLIRRKAINEDYKLVDGYSACHLPERALYFTAIPAKPVRTVRLPSFLGKLFAVAPRRQRVLALCGSACWEGVKSACLSRFPEAEFIKQWDLDEARVMDAICRNNQRKGFTDYVFCYPDVRFEQMLLFMERIADSTSCYHIYGMADSRFLSPPF